MTGDNIITAKAIGRQCGLFHEEQWEDNDGVRRPPGFAVEGPDFRRKFYDQGAEYFDGVYGRLEVMARSAPEACHVGCLVLEWLM